MLSFEAVKKEIDIRNDLTNEQCRACVTLAWVQGRITGATRQELFRYIERRKPC